MISYVLKLSFQDFQFASSSNSKCCNQRRSESCIYSSLGVQDELGVAGIAVSDGVNAATRAATWGTGGHRWPTGGLQRARNMTKLRQEAKALFEKNEPETVKGRDQGWDGRSCGAANQCLTFHMNRHAYFTFFGRVLASVSLSN